MNIFRQLMEKPWESPRGGDLAIEDVSGTVLPAATMAVRIFLCVVTVLFSLLVVAYAERMQFEDWRPTPRQWSLWFNTAFLVISSAAFQWALISVRRHRVEDAKAGLIAAGSFAVIFLLGQLWAWQEMSMMIGFEVTNPAIAFFYMITALHGLHLIGGLMVWGRTTLELWQGYDPARVELAVRLCALYWHFLLGLWLVLFGLLFSGDDNLTALLVICGFR